MYLLLACGAPHDFPADPDDWVVPALTAASVECDPVEPKWAFTAEADAWTGNGQVVLSTDGDYVETHTMYSTEAAADGTADSLALDLSVVADWRDVNAGSSTVFNCEEPSLAGILRILTRDGDTVADCRAFGEDPARWDSWDPEVACATLLTEP